MEFMLDTINIPKIRQLTNIYPISGVTTNPSIIKNEGKVDFYEHLSSIRSEFPQLSLHIQVAGVSKVEIIKDAQTIGEHFGKDVHIKIPISIEGLAAIKQLKNEGFLITGTAIISEFQGYLAIEAGVDYLAPYFNRMENNSVNSASIISNLASYIKATGSNSKVLAASFKNMFQVNQAIRAGTHAVTLTPRFII